MKSSTRKTVRGVFSLPSGKEISGELTFDGRQSEAYLEDKTRFDVSEVLGKNLTCKLMDGTRATLVNCVVLEYGGSRMRAGFGSYCTGRLFPHFIIVGNRQLSSDEPEVSRIGIVVDDASSLFYDFDAFGRSFAPTEFIKNLTEANAKAYGRDISFGDEPEILYFSGKRHVISAETELGRFAAQHNPTLSISAVRGGSLDNTISTEWTFSQKIPFNEAIDRVLVMLRFFELMIGRPQNLDSISIQENTVGDDSEPFNVYWCMPPVREPSHEDSKPGPSELLLNPITDSEAFSNVLIRWIERERAWKSARGRFSSVFGKQRRFDIDRLVGAANMFDILPPSAVPSVIELTEDVANAKQVARKAFKSLPCTIERSSILNALGRLGKATLKNKVRFRNALVSEQLSHTLPKLDFVTDRAVNCRNYFVHGSEKEFDYESNMGATAFLTDTLEFVFGVSDLIEAGWDAVAWSKRGTTMSHPFAAYHVSYRENLKTLEALIRAENEECDDDG